MKDGFIKVAAASVSTRVAAVEYNTQNILGAIDKAHKCGVNVLCLPELCVSGYTCGDLFFSDTSQSSVLNALKKICTYTADKYPVVIVGAPLKYKFKLYNCAVVILNGKILGVVPKTYLPNYNEFYEKRHFARFGENTDEFDLCGQKTYFGNLLFAHEKLSNYVFGIEICEDLWAADTPSTKLCEAGAQIIFNPSASNEVIGKDDYRRLLVSSASARLLCGYVYANADCGESTQDTVYSKHHIIAENGKIIAQNTPFGDSDFITAVTDVNKLCYERSKNTSMPYNSHNCVEVRFNQKIKENEIDKAPEKNPFVPQDKTKLTERAEAILKIQSYGLKKRIEHAYAKKCVIGVSGGLDSTLALLVTVRALDMLKRPRTDITAVTMPCFGTTKRTKSNAEKLCEYLGVTLKKIDITAAVKQHFKDIEQSESVYDVTYENSQARERTQVLMDIANKSGGIVIGTGDLSELALGWATYNGDHMSMYAVNCSVPKTLVRYLVDYEREKSEKNLADVLADILATPVSPELLPSDENGEIAQKTEELVGPYELHDFFLYYTLRFGFAPKKIFKLCRAAYKGIYGDDVIKKWLKVFTKRFFIQQFKRSCIPDGPKVGSVSLSPRSDWRMPSDAVYDEWLNELEKN